MTSWSATMSSTLLLNCALATWLFIAVGAITVSIERADIKTPPTRSSMIANGWRPLTKSYEETIGTNVSPSSHLEKNVQVHPVLSKLQEHMAASEKLKPPRKGKPPIHEYSPPSILGSFTVFGHAATKARGEMKTPSKHVASETREYTFLIPPPKDAYRFEMNQQRKPVLRDSSSHLRQPQYAASQNAYQHADPVRAASYFIKGYASTTNPSVTYPANHPSAISNRPYVPPFAMPQALQPPRHQAKPFESLKVSSNVKPFFQLPGAEIAGEFGKQKIINDHRDAYERYQSHSHSAQVNPASSGNYYSQVHHPPSHLKSTYERNPAFLVHESHEISYVTPPGAYSAYNFRPSLPYDTLLPPAVYNPSTTTPSTARDSVARNPDKHGQTNDATRERDYKRTNQSTRKKQEKGGQTELPNSRSTSTYYVSEHQELTPASSPFWPAPKSKYASDINEVLPKESPPAKFNQEVANQNQITQVPKIVYSRPYEIYSPTTAPDYETPESISLKHFNEQQFLLQQQLLQRDRERLAEQQRQQKLEYERQQQEELKQRQEQLNQFYQRGKGGNGDDDDDDDDEEARLAVESAKNQSQGLVKISGDMPYTMQLAHFQPQVTTDGSILVSQPVYSLEQLRVHSQVPQIPENQVNQNYQYHPYYQNEYQEQQVDYREPQTETRPYRPQKPSRDPQRRKKPTTVTYELGSTESPSQSSGTSVPLTLHAEDVPIRTTEAPETQTLPTATTPRTRTRRPGSTQRRRKPSTTTTTTQEPVRASYAEEEDYLRYDDRGGEVQQNQYDASRRRRIKPTQASYSEDAVTERRVNGRKRPSHRTRVSESYDTEVVTENAQLPPSSYGQSGVESGASYDESDRLITSQPSVYGANRAEEQYVTSQPINPYYDYASQQSERHREDHHEDTTVPIQVDYYGTEFSRDKTDDYNTDTRQQNVNIVTSIPLEELYVKTDGNYYDRATTAAPTTTTTETTTTTTTTPTTTFASITSQSTTPATQVVSSTLRSHKIRPLRYGNATRPRFSIKDYKSRLDYKSRISQSSTTEAASTPAAELSTRSPYTKQRTPSARTQQAGDSVRETTGRYKHVSRTSYRTTTPASASGAREQDRFAGESAPSTTEKSKYVPKRRPISSNVYRSRIATTTSSPTRSQVNSEASQSLRHNSARPENVYSSAIRRRPVAKSRPQHPHKDAVATAYADKRREESTEMAAQETNFYSGMTTAATRLVGNEIVNEKGEAASLDSHLAKLGVQEGKNEAHVVVSVHQSEEIKAPLGTIGDRLESRVEPEVTSAADDKVDASRPNESRAETTTRFDVRSDEEELFAKASQSVADLTSSASALYDKPGMFKAVSPESRVVSTTHFKVTTDEPTLPIEAFFQELTKKN